MNFDQQNIITMLGIQNLPDDRKLAILNQMTELLEKRLLLRMVKQLPETDQEKFAEILEANNPEAIQEFISAHFPDFESWISEEVNTMKSELEEFKKTSV